MRADLREVLETGASPIGYAFLRRNTNTRVGKVMPDIARLDPADVLPRLVSSVLTLAKQHHADAAAVVGVVSGAQLRKYFGEVPASLEDGTMYGVLLLDSINHRYQVWYTAYPVGKEVEVSRYETHCPTTLPQLLPATALGPAYGEA